MDADLIAPLEEPSLRSGAAMREQENLEREAFETGRRRLNAFLRKARETGTESFTAPGQWIVRQVIGPMADMLSQEFVTSNSARATRGGAMIHAIKDMDPLFLCAVAARTALNGAWSRDNGGKLSLTLVSAKIGAAIEDEWRWHEWRKLDPKQARWAQDVVNEGRSAGGARYKRAAARKVGGLFLPEELLAPWPSDKQVALGLRFVDYMVSPSVGLFEVTKMLSGRRGPSKAKLALKLSPIAVQRADEVVDLFATSQALTWPLIVPPKPWTAPTGGGFWFRERTATDICPEGLKPFPLVRWASPEQRKALDRADLSTVYAGLNAVQETPWRINKRVLGVWSAMLDGGFGPTDDIVEWDNEEPPERVPDDEWEDMSDEDRLEHRHEISEVFGRNRKAVSKRVRQHRLKRVVDRFAKYPAIYFAYNCDRRGRVYTSSSDISPQGSRLEKGLLEFAVGDELSDTGEAPSPIRSGVYWLKVVVANYYGFDKVSFDDRAKWTDANKEMILSVAARPLDDQRWWSASEKTRWQFLAACFAYQEWKEETTAGRRYVCHLPVMLDGTCNGLQHWAALLRDEKVGQFVNLVPGDKPMDLYGRVASRAREEIERAVERRQQWALECQALGIDRNFAKPVVMGFPYGRTRWSIYEEIEKALRRKIEKSDGSSPNWWTDKEARSGVVKFLVETLWTATIAETEKPDAGRKYLQAVAQEWKKAAPDTPLAWMSPSGFPVVLARRDQGPIEGRVREKLLGKLVMPRLWAGKGALYWSKLISAIAPGFIHSLDGAHLVIALGAAARSEINQLACVHDSFGTTPERAGDLAKVLRETFSEMYAEGDPIAALEEALRQAGGHPNAAPIPHGRPEPGGLDVGAMRGSLYAFG
ncbi:MAG: hypothetical protein GEV13_03170 [Rhodospirillales bacterium]|nr:hypothetical protein [Rhodospirillales bacterium]